MLSIFCWVIRFWKERALGYTEKFKIANTKLVQYHSR